MKKHLLLAARALSILLVAWWFFFVFASHGFSTITLIEFIIPFLVLFVTLIAWKWMFWGGNLFIVLGLAYMAMTFGQASFFTMMFAAGPLILTGILYLVAIAERIEN